MAKKTRRARLSPTQRYIPQPGAVAPEAPAAPAARPAAAPSRTQAISRLGKNPEEYSYIRTDLARIGILAGSIFTILVALRLFVFRS